MEINKYDIELAVDSALAQEGKEISNLWEDDDGVEYGTEIFETEEEALNWLKSKRSKFSGKQINAMKAFVEKNKDTATPGFKETLDLWKKYYLKSTVVKEETKIETKKLKNNIQKPVVKENIIEKKPTLSNNTTTIEELSGKGYIVKSGDWLSRVTKGINLSLDDKIPKKGANDIWPGDKITLEKGVLYKTRRGNKTEVGKLRNYINPTKNQKPKEDLKLTKQDKQEEPNKVTKQTKTTEKIQGIEETEATEGGANVVAPNVVEKVIESIDLESLATFYGVDIDKLSGVQTNLEELGLSFLQFLDGYKAFIETELNGLDENIIKKIKKSILLKSNKIGEIILDYKKQANEKEKNFKDYRWIVNNEIKDLFDEVNNEILPSAYLLKKYNQANNKEVFEKELMKGEDRGARFGYKLSFESIIKEIQEYFDTKPDEDGSFGEWIGRDDIIELDEERDLRILKKSGFDETSLKDINLLNERDNEIQEDANFAFMAVISAIVANDIASFTLPPWMIPGLAIGVAYDASDIADHLINNEDAAITLLKSFDLVPEEFRMKTHWYDTVLAGIGIIPGATAIIKGKKITDFTSKLSPTKLKKFNSMVDKIKSKIIGKVDTTNIKQKLSFKGNFKTDIAAENKINQLSIDNPNRIYIKKKTDNGYIVYEEKVIKTNTASTSEVVEKKVTKNKIKEKTSNNEKIPSKLHSLFKEEFNKHFNSSDTKLVLQNGENKIIIEKRSDGNFTIGNGKTIFTKNKLSIKGYKNIFKEIEEKYSEYEISYLRGKAQKSAGAFRSGEKIITKRELFKLKKSERIGKDGLEIKNPKGGWDIASDEQIELFWKNNKNIQKVLERKIEKIKINDILTKEGKEYLKKNGGSKALIETILKDIFLNKWNVGFAILFGIVDQIDDKEIDITERGIDFLKSVMLGYMMGGVLYIGGKTITLTGSAIKKGGGLTINKIISPTFKHIWNNKKKYITGVIGTGLTYSIFFSDSSEIEE